MTDVQDRLLSPAEAASFLGVHVNTVKRMGKRGEIPEYRIGPRRDRRYRVSDIESYLSNHLS